MKPLKLNIQTFDGGLSATINVDYETVGHPKTTSVRAIVTCEDYLFGENNVPEGYTLTSNNVMEKTFTSNTTETITVECYPSGNTSAAFTQDVTITVNQIGQKNTREVAYAFCGSKCAHETYTKDQIDALFSPKEETVMVPFMFRLQVKENGIYKDSKIYSQNLNIPINFVKAGNNIMSQINVTVTLNEGSNNFSYSYSTDNKTITVAIPYNDISGKTWRLLANTNSVPEKYRMWSLVKEDSGSIWDSYRIWDNEKTIETVWYQAYKRSINFYLTGGEAGMYVIPFNYFGANAD